MAFNVYFHGKEASGKLLVGVQIYEEDEAFEPIIKTKEIKQGSTHYEYTLDAFNLALDMIEGEGFDEVILLNQNDLIFKWLGNKSHDNKIRDYYYTRIKEKIKELTEDEDMKIRFQIIQGNKNEAKKEIKKYEKGMDKPVNDITSMFDIDDVGKKGNVINFNREAK